MPTRIEFQLDTNTGIETRTVQWNMEPGQAADQVQRIVEQSSDALVRVQDQRHGNYVFINTMKLAAVATEKIEEE